MYKILLHYYRLLWYAYECTALPKKELWNGVLSYLGKAQEDKTFFWIAGKPAPIQHTESKRWQE
jgi:hypothetical protein